MNPDVTGPEERRAESSTAGAFLHHALHVTCAVTPAQVA